MRFLVLLLVVLAALAGRAAAVRALDDGLAPTSSRNASIRGVGAPPDYGYKNTKPLIGILAQPCSDCPGR